METAQRKQRKMSLFDYPGRMISGSKTAPKGHICVFNANVCIKSRGKIWFGDLDLTADETALKDLAAEKGEDVYVLRERDARFTNEAKPLFENWVGLYRPNGSFAIRSDGH
jgi:hypothetical protein